MVKTLINVAVAPKGMVAMVGVAVDSIGGVIFVSSFSSLGNSVEKDKPCSKIKVRLKGIMMQRPTYYE